MTITLGTLTLEKILEWNEIHSVSIPFKKEVGEVEIPEMECEVISPRRLELIVRLNNSEKETLESIIEDANWVSLKEDGSLWDDLWIEEVEWEWRAEEDYERPWLTTIRSLCSGV